MLNEREIEQIIKIGKKVGWINSKGKRYIKGGKIKGIDVSTKWGSDSFSVKIGGKHAIITSDQHIEGTHFDTKYFDLDEIGERALRCAVSDVSITGAEPAIAFVNVAVPSTKIAEKIGDGIIRASEKLKLKLCGGDVGKSDRINISCFVIGISETKPFSRFGAKPGDHIFITGTVGDSALAFHVIKAKGRKFAEKNIPHALEKFLKPPVRKIPEKLKKLIKFTADLSDGPLITCQWISIVNSVSMEFFPERMPLSEEFLKFSKDFLKDPQSLAITWGEDYELLFGISEDNLKTEEDFRRFEKTGEVIGIVLSEKDCERAFKKKYPYIKIKSIREEKLYIFFTPIMKINPKIGFSHF